MYIVIFFIIICFSFCTSIEFDDTVINFIIDATSALFPPSIVTAFVCIENDRRIELTKTMSKEGILVQFRNIEEENINFWIFHEKRHKHLFLLDLDCPGHGETLNWANSSKILASPFKWLLLTDSTQSNDISESKDSLLIDLFLGLDIFPSSDVVIGERLQQDYIKILSIYRPSPVRDFILEDRGFWVEEKGISLYNNFVASKRRRNLQQTPLRSCIVVTYPETMDHLTDFEQKHHDYITKANYPWAIYLAQMLNATVTFAVTDTWGYQFPNGSWNGMMGMFDRNELDYGGTGAYFFHERYQIIEYINLFTVIREKFIFRRPPLSTVANLFTLPFSRKVWITIVMFMALIVALLYVAAHWEYKKIATSDKESLNIPGYELTKPTISDELLVVVGAASQQGFWYEARIVPTRIIVLITLVAAVTLYAAYAANIVALLQSTTASIKTLEDLLHSHLSLAANDHVATRQMMKTFADPIRKEIAKKLAVDGHKNWMPAEEGIRRIKEGYLAYHIETSAGYKVMQETYGEEEKCGLEEIDFFNAIDPHFVIKANSPYAELFKVGALKILETGMRSKELTRLFTKKPVCDSSSRFVSVGLTECYAAFLILGSGFAVTFGILLTEKVVKILRRRKDQIIKFTPNIIE